MGMANSHVFQKSVSKIVIKFLFDDMAAFLLSMNEKYFLKSCLNICCCMAT